MSVHSGSGMSKILDVACHLDPDINTSSAMIKYLSVSSSGQAPKRSITLPGSEQDFNSNLQELNLSQSHSRGADNEGNFSIL